MRANIRKKRGTIHEDHKKGKNICRVTTLCVQKITKNINRFIFPLYFVLFKKVLSIKFHLCNSISIKCQNIKITLLSYRKCK